jgi:hypothetical protein
MCRISTTKKLDGKGNYQGLDADWHPLAVDREVIHVRGGRMSSSTSNPPRTGRS